MVFPLSNFPVFGRAVLFGKKKRPIETMKNSKKNGRKNGHNFDFGKLEIGTLEFGTLTSLTIASKNAIFSTF